MIRTKDNVLVLPLCYDYEIQSWIKSSMRVCLFVMYVWSEDFDKKNIIFGFEQNIQKRNTKI